MLSGQPKVRTLKRSTSGRLAALCGEGVGLRTRQADGLGAVVEEQVPVQRQQGNVIICNIANTSVHESRTDSRPGFEMVGLYT